jgi:hypothetical protein
MDYFCLVFQAVFAFSQPVVVENPLPDWELNMGQPIGEAATPIVFGLGCVGALAPEIYRLYALREKTMTFSLWYILISAAFAMLGGVAAIILPAINYRAAFYAGITTPAMLSTITTKRYTKAQLTKMTVLNNDQDDPIKCSRPPLWKIVKQTFQDHAAGLFY